MPRIIPISIAAAAVTILLGAGCPSTTPPTAPTPAAPLPTVDAPANPAVPPNAPPPTTPPPSVITPTTPPTPAGATPPPAPVVRPPTVIRVTAKQWEFSPAEIRVRRGDRVTLEVTSTDVPHGFSIPEYEVNRTLNPGTTERITFTADTPGRFGFFCSVACGRGHRDMQGFLTVE